MARAQFDRNQVIQKSVDLFWQHGFTNASMQQIIAATGLKPGSIYLAFGNKEGLFRESIKYYADRSMQTITNMIEAAPSVGLGICQILEMMVKQCSESDYCSCLLIKSQLELASDNQELYKYTSEQLRKTEALYAHYLQSELDNQALATSRATSLMIHIFGIRVYGYQDGSENAIIEGLRTGLPWLPWQQQ